MVPLGTMETFKNKMVGQTDLFRITISSFNKAVNPKTDKSKRGPNSKQLFRMYEPKPMILLFDFSEYFC